MELTEPRAGVYRWTAPHPDWRPDADWPADVGCVAHAAPEGLVLVDPLVPRDDWAALDGLVAAHGPQVFVLTTTRWHDRSADAVMARYGAERPAGAPAGVRAIPVPPAEEALVWLEGPRALVPGDALLGTPGGGVRMCPQDWLDDPTADEQALRAALLPVLDLPVELILLSHGEPVLERGHAALADALSAVSTG